MQAFYQPGWTYTPKLEIIDRLTFSASVRWENGLIVQISTGCIKAIEQLRGNCLVAFGVDAALEWLILHELHHADLGHFGILDGVPSLHLVSRSKREATSLDDLPKDMHDMVSPCLELQADHDAFEMMLDDYSAAKWDSIRTQAASIAAVMVLIEKVDAEKGANPSSHPKAATRIFQLLGHVAEMWSIPAHAKTKVRGVETIRSEDLPTEDELQAFSKEVILPVFWDAVALAEAADAKSIISDLGSPEDFFADIGRAKLGQWNELVTVGAKEWATLKDANEAILPLLSINHAVN